MKDYIRDISKIPLLTPSEERSLAKRIRRGDQVAREQMARSNLRLVINLARKFSGRGIPLEDLVGEGNVGLMRAIEKFRPSKGCRFSTYATWWILHALRRACTDKSRLVRLPAYVQDHIPKVGRASSMLRNQLAREPSTEELADATGLKVAKVRLVERAATSHRIPLEDFRLLSEIVEDRRSKTSEALLAEETLTERIGEMLDSLDARLAMVLRMRFGIDDGEPKTLKEVGSRLNLSRERVRQLEGCALRRLRARAEELV